MLYSFLDIFIGVPVYTILFAFFILCSASWKDINILSTFFANIFTAFPGNALLSCKTTGTLYLFAAKVAAPHMYPPAPITISGLNSFIIFFASSTPRIVFNIFLRFAIEISLLIPYASIVFSS